MTEKSHLEARLLKLIGLPLGLWLERLIDRMFPALLLTIPIVLLLEPDSSLKLVVWATWIAGVWGIADLARGIEIDHKTKDKTLRDRVIAAWNDRRGTND